MNKYVKNFARYRYLLIELVKKGIKLKYRRSYLGLIWTMLEPLLTMIVLTIVFGQLLGKGDRLYPVYILCGRLIYSCFSSSTKIAMRSIRAKYLYPLSSCIYNYILFLLSLIVLAVVSIVLGVPLTWHVIEAVIPLTILFILSIGAGMVLSTVCVFFRDMEYLWDVVLMLVMYCSAIFYKITSMGQGLILIKLNPLYGIISNFRAVLLEGHSMFNSYSYGVSNLKLFAYSGTFSVVLLIFGIYVFKKNQDKFILHI